MASHGVAYTSFPGADRAVAQLLRVLLRRAGNKSEGFNMESRITTGECISLRPSVHEVELTDGPTRSPHVARLKARERSGRTRLHPAQCPFFVKRELGKCDATRCDASHLCSHRLR